MEIGAKCLPKKVLVDHMWSCCDLDLWPFHLRI